MDEVLSTKYKVQNVEYKDVDLQLYRPFSDLLTPLLLLFLALTIMYEAKLIDIEAVVKAKLPKHYPKVPKWVFRFAEWLICQKEMNHVITTLRDKEGPDFAQGVDGQEVGLQCHDIHQHVIDDDLELRIFMS